MAGNAKPSSPDSNSLHSTGFPAEKLPAEEPFSLDHPEPISLPSTEGLPVEEGIKALIRDGIDMESLDRLIEDLREWDSLKVLVVSLHGEVQLAPVLKFAMPRSPFLVVTKDGVEPDRTSIEMLQPEKVFSGLEKIDELKKNGEEFGVVFIDFQGPLNGELKSTLASTCRDLVEDDGVVIYGSSGYWTKDSVYGEDEYHFLR